MSRQKPNAVLIFGIPILLRSVRTHKVIKQVLLQIRGRAPKDFKKVQDRVCKIIPLPLREGKDGTIAEWVRLPRTPKFLNDPKNWGKELDGGPGYLKIAENLPHPRWAGTLAHEFGHVCADFVDWQCRGECPSDEWASELTADWYAYKWGFGKEVAKYRKNRAWTHHCAGPGRKIEVNGVSYFVTRNFVMKKLPP